MANPNFDENRWVIQIRRTLEEEIEEEAKDPVSIFCVPKNLMVTDPDSYIPQQVALGPYHHWRYELYDMERYKLSAAKRAQKQMQNHKFQHLVDELTKFEPGIRAVYHKFINFSGETLIWMMAVDASFLLEFLQIFAPKEGKVLTIVSSRMSHLVDIAGRKSAHSAILRDMIMLENQIPLFLLRKILEFQFSSLEVADNMLLSMLMGFCEELSPFKMMEMEQLPDVHVMECAHLLDFLYQVIVPKSELLPSEIDEQSEVAEAEASSFGASSYVKQLRFQLWKTFSKLNKRIVFSMPIKALLKLPWTFISNIPVVRVIKQPIDYLCFTEEKVEEKPTENSAANSRNKPPVMEEITIPSVSELSKAGVKILPANGGILSITFDDKTSTFYLPTMSLDTNTKVVLRNLVAYEACNASGPLVFTRYTELMNGIIDTEEDAKLLRERGIILSRLKSDEEVADLWNGMSRSVRLTKVPFLDQVIEDVNKHFNGSWKVKIGNFMESYVFGSWQFLTLVTAIILLLLMASQVFCSIYGCRRANNPK